MKKRSFAKSLASVGLAAVCALGIVGCSEQTSDTPTYTGGVAATVNGVEIPEDKVTQAIQDIRAQMSLTEEDAWGQWLADNDYTPESVREEIVNSFVDQELVKQGGEAEGITADPTEIDQYVETMRGHYDSDTAWAEALEAVGMTEDEYRSEIELQLKAKELYNTFTSSEEPSNDDMLQYAQMYASAYDGAKRSSHILFDSDDEATAQDVLNKINSGELDFAEAAKQYSKDTGSKDAGGDVGWDKTSSFVKEYTDALSGLEKDQVSGLVTSSYGIHIIKCTDVYNAPKEKADDGTETVKITSLDQIPSEWLETIKQSLQSQGQTTNYQNWLTEKKESSDLKINDMPSGLPYDVDMSKYQTEDPNSTDNADTNVSAADSTDGDASAGTDGSADSSASAADVEGKSSAN